MTKSDRAFIKISSHTPKYIQEGIADIICEDIDILSHPIAQTKALGQGGVFHRRPNSNFETYKSYWS